MRTWRPLLGPDLARAFRDFARYRGRYRKIIEHMEFDLILSQFPAQSRISVLDVGAHHGEIIDILRSSACRHVFDVLCVEPLPINLVFLRTRAMVATLSAGISIRVVSVALGSETRMRTFRLGRASTLFTSDPAHESRFGDWFRDAKDVDIKQMSWCDLAQEYGLRRDAHFDIVKIDTEGSDFEILQELVAAGCTFDAVIVEFSFSTPMLCDYLAQLRDLGLTHQYAFLRDAAKTTHVGSLATDEYLRGLLVDQPQSTGNLVCFRPKYK